MSRENRIQSQEQLAMAGIFQIPVSSRVGKIQVHALKRSE
jgi:hypothetical protein